MCNGRAGKWVNQQPTHAEPCEGERDVHDEEHECFVATHEPRLAKGESIHSSQIPVRSVDQTQGLVDAEMGNQRGVPRAFRRLIE